MAQLTDDQFDLLMEALETMQPDSQELRLVIQGITLGFGEEAEALVRAPFQSEGYTEIRDNLRTKLNSHRERAPTQAAAYEMVGAMLPAIATAGASTPLSTVNAARPVVRAMQLGMGEGALAAVGLSEREGVDSLKDAPLGATIGAATGPAGYYAGKALGGASDKFLEFVRQRGKGRMGTVVENELNRLADQTGLTRDELFERIAAGETMSDNQSLHSTVRSYMSQGGESESMVRKAVSARADSARSSAKEAVEIGLTGGTKGNVLKYAKMKEGEWKKALGQAYDNVFKVNGKKVDANPDLSRQALEVVQRVPEALAELKEIYQVRNLVPLFKTADNGAIQMNRVPTLEDVEIIRRMTSEQAEVAGRAGRGTLKSELMLLEDNLKTNIDGFSPDLKDTRAGWSRMADARDAFDSGKKAFTGDVEAFEVLAESVMSSGDTAKISAFREGIMSSINNKMSVNGSKRFLAKLANPELREGRVFANVFPEDKQKSALVKLALQGKTQLSYEKIIDGPSTALINAATKQQNLGIGADELLSASAGNLSSGISVGMKAIKALAPNLTDGQRRQITEVLLSENPKFVKNALSDSGNMAQLQNRVRKLADMITSGSVSAGGYEAGKGSEFAMKGLLGEAQPDSMSQGEQQ